MQRALLLCLVVILASVASVIAEVPPQMTIQGRVTDAGGTPLPAGVKNFTFRIFDAPTSGTQVWPAAGGEIQSITSGADGLWIGLLGAVIPLSDSVFADSNRWLEVDVSGTTLPRVRLITGPYAYRVSTVDGASGGTITSKLSIGPGHTNTGIDAFVAGSSNSVAGGGATISGGANNSVAGFAGAIGGGQLNRVSANYATVGGGYADTAGNPGSTVAGGQENAAIGDFATVGGGQGNKATQLETTIGGGRDNLAIGFAATVSGGRENQATATEATVGGGQLNIASNSDATVGGGQQNQATAFASTIAGGYLNQASGTSAFIGGGRNNSATGDSTVVVGGTYNTAGDRGAVVVGGSDNHARGRFSFIGGGGGMNADSNSALGMYSAIVGGNHAIAEGDFSFVGGGYVNKALRDYDVAVGGEINTADGPNAAVVGGEWNQSTGTWAFVGAGRGNIASNIHAGVASGDSNTASGNHTFIGSGRRNIASGGYGVILGGQLNTASGAESAILGGNSNTASSGYSAVMGGYHNRAAGKYASAAGKRAKADHAGCFVWADSTDADFTSSGINQFLVRASGGVGIGTSSPEGPVHVQKGSAGAVTANSNSIAVFETSSTNGWLSILGSDNTERGLLFTEPSSAVAGAIVFDQGGGGNDIGFRTGGNVTNMTLDASGNLTVIGCVDGNNTACASDRRFKKNITTVDDALSLIEDLRGVRYEWRADEFPERHFESGAQYGVIAQEVREVVPEVIREREDGYLSVEYTSLIPILLEAIKAQQKRLDALEKKLEKESP